jgi:hypothetical protein
VKSSPLVGAAAGAGVGLAEDGVGVCARAVETHDAALAPSVQRTNRSLEALVAIAIPKEEVRRPLATDSDSRSFEQRAH